MDLNLSLSLKRGSSQSQPREWDLNQPLPQEQGSNQSLPQERDHSLPLVSDLNQPLPPEQDLNQSLPQERDLNHSLELDLNQPLPKEQDLNQSLPQERGLNQSLPNELDLNQLAPRELTPCPPDLAHYSQEYYRRRKLDLALRQFFNRQSLHFLDLLRNPGVKIKNKLPPYVVKRAMKSDPSIKRVSLECPTLLAKACELFISELTLRAWEKSKENNRKHLQRSDIAQAVRQEDSLMFLANAAPLVDPRPLLDLNAEYVPSSSEAEQAAMASTSAGFDNGQPTKMRRLSAKEKGKAKQW